MTITETNPFTAPPTGRLIVAAEWTRDDGTPYLMRTEALAYERATSALDGAGLTWESSVVDICDALEAAAFDNDRIDHALRWLE
jgi:hypothetical protein